MERLTKTYSDGTHGAADNLPCGENSYRDTTLSPEQVRTLQTRFADVSLRLGEYMAIGTPEECREAVMNRSEVFAILLVILALCPAGNTAHTGCLYRFQANFCIFIVFIRNSPW